MCRVEMNKDLENTAGKGKNASLFPTVFSKSLPRGL